MKKKLAIIGGGIAGLTLAHCLNKDDFEIEIFDKKSSFGEIGAAISVFPNALCVMDEIGLLDKILDSSGRFQNVYLKTKEGKILSETRPKSDYPVVCMHRADLHSVLLENIDAELHTGMSLKQLSCLESGKVEVQFENGVYKIFDAVIGADGIHSNVRKYVLNDGQPIFRGYNIWRGVVKTTFDVGYASETYGSGQRVGIVPIKDGVYGWWATSNEAYMQDDEPEGTKNRLNKLFGDWHHPIPDLINNTEEILKNSLTDRVPKKGWTKGNITLIGDAAHPTTPNLGQGGCIAMEGAFILAKCLEKYGLTDKAYQRYEELQFSRSETVVKESLQIGKIGQLSNPFLISLRNTFFRMLPSSLAMKMVDKFFSYRVTKLKI